jgi:hypothetical protein
MNRTDALNRAKADSLTGMRDAHGTDGNRWYRARRNRAGNEFTSELGRTQTGGVSEHQLEDLDPGPQVDWQPGKTGPPKEWPGPTLEDGQVAPLEPVGGSSHFAFFT